MPFFAQVFKYFVLLDSEEEFGILSSLAYSCTALVQHPLKLNDYRLSIRQNIDMKCIVLCLSGFKKFSFRVLVFTALVSTFVIYSSYCAALISALTLDIYYSPIKQMGDVMKKGYTVLIWKGTSFEAYFRDAPKNSPAAEVALTYIQNVPVNNFELQTCRFGTNKLKTI